MKSIREYLISTILSLFILVFVHPSVSFAPEYALAMASFFEGKCRVIIWIHDKSESKKIEYLGELSDKLCSVYVPREKFEKDFKYCLLSGISVAGGASFKAAFGGGPAGDRDVYWFEWRDAQNVFPSFFCFLK